MLQSALMILDPMKPILDEARPFITGDREWAS
jgi:hypothetical protein